jgi:hypothetical protein
MQPLFKFISIAPPRLLDSTGCKDASQHIKDHPLVVKMRRESHSERQKIADGFVSSREMIAATHNGVRQLLAIASMFHGAAPVDPISFENGVVQQLSKSPQQLVAEPRFKALCHQIYLGLFMGRLAAHRISQQHLSTLGIAARVCAVIEALGSNDVAAPTLLQRPWLQLIIFKRLETAKSQVTPPVKDVKNSGATHAKPAVGKPDMAQLDNALVAIRAAYATTPPAQLLDRISSLPQNNKPPKTLAKKKANSNNSALPSDVQKLIKSFGITPNTAEDLETAEAEIRKMQGVARMEMRRQNAKNTAISVNFGGGSFLGHINRDDLFTKPDFTKPLTLGVPKSVGSPHVIGEGMLVRVEDTLLGYETGAIARVVNIPATATKSKESSIRVRTEESSEEETSESSSQETSVEKDERFSLSLQTQKEIHNEMSLNPAGAFSASYGPVTAEASVESSLSFGSSSATSTASEYAKSVIEKAVSAIAQSKRNLHKRSRLTEVTEIDKEGYDNATGSNVTAIYHWIDEVRQGRLLHYGSRLLMEFIVPKPGAVLLWAMTGVAQKDLPVAPKQLTICIEDIDPDSYLDFLEDYGVTNAPTPPVATQFVSKVIAIGDDIKDQTDTRRNMIKIEESLQIPEGYYVNRYWVALDSTRPRDGAFISGDTDKLKNARYAISVGKDFYYLNGQRSIAENKEHNPNSGRFIVPLTGQMPISITGIEDRAATATVILRCLPKNELLDQWRLDVYSALQQAYQRKLSEYEDQLRMARVGHSLANASRNPEQNRMREREEMKRAAITQLTAQHFEAFDSIQPSGSMQVPEVRFADAREEGSYVEFFERSCEWTQLEFLLYPYFWADPEKNWLQALSLRMDDPKHEEFLKAGYARIVVPVRPGFEGAMLTYLSHPERPILWDGKSFADIDMDDELYFPIWKAIMERQAQTETAPIQIGDPWRFKIPTDHQIISSSGTLPPPP